jgi:integrase
MSEEKGKRTYGSGALEVHRGAWYGRWRVGTRQVRRKLGAIREPGSREGLTRKQAEMALRRLMTEVRVVAPEERMTIEDAGERYLHHLEHVCQRKAATVQDYRIMLKRHLAPYFSHKSIDRISVNDVTTYIAVKSRELAINTVNHQMSFAHGIFAHAIKQGWATSNPVAMADKPPRAGADQDIHFLTTRELEALLEAAQARIAAPAAEQPESQVLAATDYVIYLTAAMTGLRQGELVALRWRDVDWMASVIRVRRNYTRNAWGQPKSKRSSRAVPMADRVAGALDRHFKASAFQGDEDLVFCHPQTGNPYDASKMRQRFYKAMKAAKMGDRCGRKGGITFHSLRHTFGTRMAAVGAPMRTLQEWMGHADFATTLVYADFSPDPTAAAAFAERAFGEQPESQADEKPEHVSPQDGLGEWEERTQHEED